MGRSRSSLAKGWTGTVVGDIRVNGYGCGGGEEGGEATRIQEMDIAPVPCVLEGKIVIKNGCNMTESRSNRRERRKNSEDEEQASAFGEGVS